MMYYINKNETRKGLECLNKCVNLRSNTNVMILRIPHRYDLSIDSCVNKEVVTFNRKLHKLMRNKQKVKVLDYKITRVDFTLMQLGKPQLLKQ